MKMNEVKSVTWVRIKPSGQIEGPMTYTFNSKPYDYFDDWVQKVPSSNMDQGDQFYWVENDEDKS